MTPPRHTMRYVIAIVLLGTAALAATLIAVRSGSAVVVTRLGAPVRVHTAPGLAWKLPAPVERTIAVDLRLRTTSTGMHAVLTRDGLSITLQAWVAWRVQDQDAGLLRFVQAVQNRPEEAATQLRTLLGSAMETVAGRFTLSDLINTDPANVRLAELESAIAERVRTLSEQAYGITVAQIGIERIMLPETTLNATITRMKAERETVAEQKKADGRRIAAEITANAEKEARLLKAKASEDASRIDAEARKTAAAIYGAAHQADPQLYAYLRSLDTLEQVIGPSTRLVLRTDSAPFRALIDGPAIGSLSAAAP